MALMVISVFLERLFPNFFFNECLWVCSIVIHIALMVYFIAVHILLVEVTLECVYPSWFITFVGIGVIPNTSSFFIKEIGEITVWIALILYFILLPIIVKRIVHKEKMQDSVIPLITILTAPGSLCLAGYLSVYKDTSVPFVLMMLILSQVLYVCVVLNLNKMLKVGFYPSYAAFTFPLVISATAIYKSTKVLMSNPILLKLIIPLSIIETLLAVLIVCYVLFKYLIHMYSQTKQAKMTHDYK